MSDLETRLVSANFMRIHRSHLINLEYVTSIEPYEEQIAIGRKTLRQRQGATDTELEYAALDVNLGMLFSNVVMYFIILSTAATLFKSGKTDIQSATDAAQALRPLAGRAAEALLAIGLIGAGFLAVPILTGSSAYAVAEAFGWKHGLDKHPECAKEFYVLIAVVSTVLGMLINFGGINPIKALFWTAVINGFLAPPLLVLIMMISNNQQVMGKRVNSRLLNILGWITVTVMSAADQTMPPICPGSSSAPSAGQTKRSNRTVPLGPKGVAILSGLAPEKVNPEMLIFGTRNGTPLSRRNLMNRQLTPTCEQLGLKGVNWHWLRHANATLLDSVGTPLSTTQALLGHSSAKITSEIYLHSIPADARNAVVKVENLIEDAKPKSESGSEVIGPTRTQVFETAELASSLIQ